MAYAVLNTMAIKAKDIDSMNRVAFVGAVDGTTASKFNADSCEQGVIVTMDKMCKFSPYTVIAGTDSRGNTFSRSLKSKEGYAYTANKAAAQTKADLWIIDNHEVGYDVASQSANAIDPRTYINEAGRPVSARKLSKGDFLQVSEDAFSTEPTDGTTTYVEVAANGKLKAVTSSTNAAFKYIGKEDMYFGDTMVDAYIIECIVD